MSVRGRAPAPAADSREFDLSATGGRTWAQAAATHFGDNDAGSLFAAHLARFVDGLLERTFHAIGESLEGLFHRLGIDLKHQRKHTRGGQELGLPGEKYLAGVVDVAVDGHGSQLADGARAPVCEYFFAVHAGRV